MVDFSDSFRMGNLSTDGSFFKASVSQITSKSIFMQSSYAHTHAKCFADNVSCVVEIYDDTGVISASNSKFCKFTWRNGMHI